MRWLGKAAVLAVFACCTAAAGGNAAPERGAPLYVAERGSSKVYIFGACGAQGGTWLSPRIRSALAESMDLWRELPVPKLDPAAIAYSDKLGAFEHGSLFDHLSAEETLRVLKAAAKFGVPRARLAPMKIWYASRILTFASYARAGKPVGQGKDPELVLSDLAARQGKPIKAESPDWYEFARFFDRMPEPVQKQYLAYSLDDIENGPQDSLAGDAACGRGDPSFFSKSAADFSMRYPELYKYLNADRDAAWAQRINKLLADGGVHFIVVGVNHTVGPGSIQNELKHIGIPTHRV